MYVIDKISDIQSLATVQCQFCGHEYSFTVNTQGLDRWMHGQLIQLALPELSKANRELLVSNTCDNCFQKMFPQ